VTWNTKLYTVKLNMPKELRYSKDLSLDEIREFLIINPYGKGYDKYIEPGLLYFTEDIDELKRGLGVNEIAPMGLYIRGIYGGEEKKGQPKYAGLALEQYSIGRAVFRFKLFNTKDELIVPLDLMKRYGVGIYRMVYGGEINPFRLNKYVDILLSQKCEQSLKQFLKDALDLNSRNISEDTQKKVEGLINELKQPNSIGTLNPNKYYVVYRCDRAFTACVIKPEKDDIVSHSNVSYVECNNETVAYYYSAVLNYLAFKVIELKRGFNRHQYARPLLAVIIAGLSWNDLDEETRRNVAELSRALHSKVPREEYGNQRVALNEISKLNEFHELKSILDSKVDKERLEEALKLVS
jgi:hypothetical protein